MVWPGKEGPSSDEAEAEDVQATGDCRSALKQRGEGEGEERVVVVVVW